MSVAMDLLTEACAHLRPRVQPMFGGHGFFAPNGGMFAAIVTDDQVILKFEEGPQRDALLKLGGAPWTYDGKKKPMVMKQWIVVPLGFYDDLELFAQWAEKAYRAAPPKRARVK